VLELIRIKKALASAGNVGPQEAMRLAILAFVALNALFKYSLRDVTIDAEVPYGKLSIDSRSQQNRQSSLT